MGKIKKKIKDISIIPTFIFLTIAFILCAMFVIECERTLLTNAQYDIAFKYSDIVEGFNGKKVWNDNDKTFSLSESDSKKMQTYQFLLDILPPLTYVAFSFLASYIFYKSKIKKPLKILSDSAKKISENNLDFVIQYDKSDEMGMLCSSFEKMRSELEKNNYEMWRQIEERKKLSAAFSHDLRTPLTILEGYLDILKKYAPDEKDNSNDIMDTYLTMSKQIDRLKNYVSSMSKLQKLEDISIEIKEVQTEEFIESLKDIAYIIGKNKKIEFDNEVESSTIFIDSEIVVEVFENIMSNAIRYADSEIIIKCKSENNSFSISIEDDGKGFDGNALKKATDPFFTTEAKESGQHFGLGLNICKILCERHNGKLIFNNKEKNGAIITMIFKDK